MHACLEVLCFKKGLGVAFARVYVSFFRWMQALSDGSCCILKEGKIVLAWCLVFCRFLGII
jgi:hypothetical protein